MPQENQPTGADKQPASPKMIPESQLIALKNASLGREKRLKEELATAKNEVVEFKSQLRIARAGLEDGEEEAKVRQYLIDEDKKLSAERERLEKLDASIKERDKEARIQALATEYKVDIDLIKDVEDPEKEALRLTTERLTKETEELKTHSPETLFETGTPGSVKTQPKDMSSEDFAKHVTKLRTEALSKK